MAKKITGKRENSTGGNTHYEIDNKKIITRAEGVRMVEKGELEGYHTVKINRKKYVRDNPDSKKKDNVDEQKDI